MLSHDKSLVWGLVSESAGVREGVGQDSPPIRGKAVGEDSFTNHQGDPQQVN